MLALLPPVNSLLLMWFVRIIPTNEADDKKYLDVFSLAAVVLAAYLMAVIIIENILTFRLTVRISTFVVLILFLLSHLYIAIKAEKEKASRIFRSLLEQNQLIYSGNQLDRDVIQTRQDAEGYHEIVGDADEDMIVNNRRTIPELGENLNLLQSICTIDFWLLCFTSACGMGSGLATVNNISQIGQSFGYSTLATSTLISLWSIWNFGGRFGSGYVSDYFLHAKGWPRPIFIAITLAVMSVGHVVIASGLPGALYAGSVLVGIGYGSQWSLMPTIVSEIFGPAHMGAIFNTITIANPIGTYILSVRVVGYIYDKEATRSDHTCTGTHCFMLSFLIMASTTILASLVGLILFFRTRRLYKQVIFRRLHIPSRNLQ